jgi:flagellar transcriptional activator FlhD
MKLAAGIGQKALRLKCAFFTAWPVVWVSNRSGGRDDGTGLVGICLTRCAEETGLKKAIWADVAALLRSLQFVALQQHFPTTPGHNAMNTDQILAEIREANLSYLMLAQTLIRVDQDQALFRLGLSEESAAMIAALTPAQMMKIASGNTLLCRMRCDDDLVWCLLTSHGKGAANESVSRLHASILMAGRHQEAA